MTKQLINIPIEQRLNPGCDAVEGSAIKLSEVKTRVTLGRFLAGNSMVAFRSIFSPGLIREI